jgi:Na+:H+ antiporter, NhaA family
MNHQAVVDHTVMTRQSVPWWTMRRLGQFVLDHLLLLPVGALLAIVWANTSAESYYRFSYAIDFWVNDVAMALFFGLLMKEVVEAREAGGVLHSLRTAAMPAIAAVGATVVSGGIYVWFMRLTNEPMLEPFWPIAITTDLALSYFVARLVFGRHALVAFVLALGLATNAVAFLTAPLVLNPADLQPLTGIALMGLAIGTAAVLRHARVNSFWAYVLVGGGVSWCALYVAGIHPGLALVPVIPFMPRAARDPGFFVDARDDAHDALSRFELASRYPVHVTLFLFGLVNAGVLVGGLGTGYWGIALASVLGKPIGILAAVGLALAAGFHLPRRVGWREMAVASVAAASGFTIALFMAGAMLGPGPLLAMTRMGALLSVAAAPLAIVLAKVLRVGRFAR